MAIRPIVVGMDRPVHVLSRGVEVPDIVNVVAAAAVDAESRRGSES